MGHATGRFPSLVSLQLILSKIWGIRHMSKGGAHSPNNVAHLALGTVDIKECSSMTETYRSG